MLEFDRVVAPNHSQGPSGSPGGNLRRIQRGGTFRNVIRIDKGQSLVDVHVDHRDLANPKKVLLNRNLDNHQASESMETNRMKTISPPDIHPFFQV